MKSSKGEGTKIAQAAKDLNVTSVTIRRYISEFNIETTSDENGIKVLPENAMEELHEIRKLKEDGLTNPKVLEILEERRSKPEKKTKEKPEAKKTAAKRVAEPKPEAPPKKEAKAKPEKKPTRRARADEDEDESEEEAAEEEVKEEVAEQPAESDKEEEGDAGDGRSKHSLTCQTCTKVFEHMNPRLRDCLDCYRAKRKERRRGGDKHKNVIAHPLAQQVANKTQAQQQNRERASEEGVAVASAVTAAPAAVAVPRSVVSVAPSNRNQAVRNYRKAIEETRQITSNLKRRLERPDLPEGERRWLEQIYAYQLILHQGWRHLAEYKAGNQPQPKDRGES